MTIWFDKYTKLLQIVNRKNYKYYIYKDLFDNYLIRDKRNYSVLEFENKSKGNNLKDR